MGKILKVKDKPFEVPSWNYILVEGYCTINWKYRLKYSKYVYRWKNGKTKKVKNKDYDPTVKMEYPPEYCLGHISINCIKCKHLAHAMVEPWLQKKFRKVVNDER